MIFYGTALLAGCLFIGMAIGQLIGSALGVDSDIGGVGIAMLNNGHRVEDVFALGLVREAAVAWGERATAP